MNRLKMALNCLLGRSVVYRAQFGRPKHKGRFENTLVVNITDGGIVTECDFNSFSSYSVGGQILPAAEVRRK